MSVETYHLIAYEVETNNEVLNCSGVAPTPRFYKENVIVDGDTRWQVVGVRKTSTEKLWLVDLIREG